MTSVTGWKLRLKTRIPSHRTLAMAPALSWNSTRLHFIRCLYLNVRVFTCGKVEVWLHMQLFALMGAEIKGCVCVCTCVISFPSKFLQCLGSTTKGHFISAVAFILWSECPVGQVSLRAQRAHGRLRPDLLNSAQCAWTRYAWRKTIFLQ